MYSNSPEYTISTNSLPTDDKQWQRVFKQLKTNTKSVDFPPDTLFSDDPIYADFIGYMLEYIRNGGKDYCFYIYQIIDLLKYEKDRLCARWIPDDECFLVWLKI